MKEANDIYCCINSAAIWGIQPYIVKIESDISQGMPVFHMVGLLSSEVREARERVRTALKNIGHQLPYGRITINLSPADRKKEGARFDLAIAVALLVNMKIIKEESVKEFLIVGELGLNGDINGINGVLPIIIMAKQQGFRYCMIPFENGAEGKVIEDIYVVPVRNLYEAIEYFNERKTLSVSNRSMEEDSVHKVSFNSYGDISEIYGHETVKRAITVAAAGKHNLLMIGPPGSGKSMIASRIPGIMPNMSVEERLEISSIHSICGILKERGLIRQRPFRAPHHSITLPALVGGGTYPKPGELTIAHGGVLFFDELPEFHPKILDALRQPLEEKRVRVVRNGGKYEFPADCLFVAAMNPCRCGFYPDRNKCNCSLTDIRKYLGRISGPFLDRMDMCIDVPRQSFDESAEKRMLQTEESSDKIKKQIDRAVQIQFQRNDGKYNSQISVEEVRKYCELDTDCNRLIRDAYQKFSLSMRSYYKIIKTARTIADLDGSDDIRLNHLGEALGYRISNGKYDTIL